MKVLHVMPAVAHVVRSTVDNLGFAFRISWPWLVLIIPFTLWLDISLKGDVRNLTFEQNPGAILALLGLFIVNLIGFASIAVNWHR